VQKLSSAVNEYCSKIARPGYRVVDRPNKVSVEMMDLTEVGSSFGEILERVGYVY